MKAKTELWKQVCSKDNLEMEPTDDLLALGQFLGGQSVLFRKSYLSFLQKEPLFEYKPTIGAKLLVHFDYEQEKVDIQRSPIQLTLTFDQFASYMGLIDAVFSEVYPIGTVIELDETLLTKDVQAMFSTSELGLSVIIHGRRLPIEDTTSCIDYVTSLWPFGMQAAVEPIYVNNLMIKRVLSTGMTNEYEDRYVFEVLRRQWIDQGNRSNIYK